MGLDREYAAWHDLCSRFRAQSNEAHDKLWAQWDSFTGQWTLRHFDSGERVPSHAVQFLYDDRPHSVAVQSRKHFRPLGQRSRLQKFMSGIAVLLLDTGLRGGEALSLDWRQVRFEPAKGARHGYVTILSGNAKNGKSRNVPLTVRAAGVLRRCEPSDSGLVFHRADGSPLSHTWLDQQHAAVRRLLKLPADFVLHSLRHTFGTRLGEAGGDAFTIMKAIGHSSVTVSQRYVHPSPEAMETAFERLERLNDARRLGVGIESGIVDAGLGAIPLQVV